MQFCRFIFYAFLLFVPIQAIADMACVQSRLNALGFEAGVADGLIGSKTRAASTLYLEAMGADLPELSRANSDIWCSELADTNMPIAGLEGIGINTAFMWSAASTNNPRLPETVLNHIKPIQEHGFNSLFVVACVDWIIQQRCKKAWQSRDDLIEAINILLDNTDLHLALSFKGYETKKVNGKNISTLQARLEREPEVQRAFVDEWRLFAREFSDIPRERLSFVLLNEPEFQLPNPTDQKRRAWEKIASAAIEAIREISPNRVIILEGIAKSKFNERWKKSGAYKYTLDNLMQPLPYPDLIYAVHSYSPRKFTDQSKNREGFNGIAYSSKIERAIRSDAQRLLKWQKKHGVPVMVSETGCISKVEGYEEGTPNLEDCGKYAGAYREYFAEAGIPVIWWAIEKERTIYIRTKNDCSFYSQKNCDTWVPRSRIPNPYIFEGLGLNLN